MLSVVDDGLATSMARVGRLKAYASGSQETAATLFHNTCHVPLAIGGNGVRNCETGNRYAF